MLGSVPQRLGPYELLRQIGSGGMATVYLGRDTRTEGHVAIKVLSAELSADPKFLSRFRREADLARRINNPHVVKVLDSGIENGRPYLAMEYVQGTTLSQHIDAVGSLSIEDAIDYTRQAAAGLAAAHAQDVIHRDVKAQNLMLASGVVKIMDFGIARDVDASLSRTRMFTPHFASPEQVRALPVDHRTDLYSLGVRWTRSFGQLWGPIKREFCRSLEPPTCPPRAHVVPMAPPSVQPWSP